MRTGEERSQRDEAPAIRKKKEKRKPKGTKKNAIKSEGARTRYLKNELEGGAGARGKPI